MTATEKSGWTDVAQAVTRATESFDAFKRAVFRAGPEETTQEAGDRFEAEQVAMWVGHPVQRLEA